MGIFNPSTGGVLPANINPDRRTLSIGSTGSTFTLTAGRYVIWYVGTGSFPPGGLQAVSIYLPQTGNAIDDLCIVRVGVPPSWGTSTIKVESGVFGTEFFVVKPSEFRIGVFRYALTGWERDDRWETTNDEIPQTIIPNVAYTAPALQIIQKGTGDAFRVDDEANDSTPFRIDANGRVGIGVDPDSSVALSVDSTGIKFSNGTIMTSAGGQQPSDWNATSGVTQILNKPNIEPQYPSDWNATTGVTRIVNKPTIPAAQVQTDWNATTGLSSILNKPTIPAAQVQTDWNLSTGIGSILNKPTIPAAQVQTDWNALTGLASIANKPSTMPPTRNVFGPMVIQRFGNWNRGQSGYAPGNPPAGMFPIYGNVVENFNDTTQFPRLFNAGQFFGTGRTYQIICAVRCNGIVADGVHMQLRYFNGTTMAIIPGLMDFGGGNDGVAQKAYWGNSTNLTSLDEWWVFVPYAGAYTGASFASIQDVVVIAYLV